MNKAIFIFCGILFILIRKNFLGRSFPVTLTLVFFVVSLLFSIFSKTILNSGINNRQDITQRLELAYISGKIISTNFLVGTGLNTFVINEIKIPGPNSYLWLLQPVHNIYLLVFAETGLVGLVAFLLLIGNGIWRGIHSIWNRNKRDVASPTVMYTIPFIGLLMLGLVDHYPLSLQQGQLLFTLFAALQFVLPY